ncbi:MAG: PepSY domain-containing protein [Fibrobacterota bacterium]
MMGKQKRSFIYFMRQIHFWVTLFVMVPIFIVTTSGLVLMVKKQSDWVQPPTQRGSATAPTLSFADILTRVSGVDSLGVSSWKDIDRLDVRPDKGVIKVRTENHRELQMDAATGEILQTAVRRSDVIEAVHDGSFFGKRTKYLVFFTAEILFFLQLLTGIILFIHIIRRRLQQKRNRSAAENA